MFFFVLGWGFESVISSPLNKYYTENMYYILHIVNIC